VDVRPVLIADAQPSELVQPCQSALHNPAVDAQTAAVPPQTLSEHWHNPQGAQRFPMGSRAIGPVPLDLAWSVAWPAAFPWDGRNSCYQRQQLGDIIAVSAGENGGQWDSLGVGDHVMFAAQLPPVRGIGPCFSPRLQPHGLTRYLPRLVTSQSCQPPGAWPRALHGASSRPLLPATPVAVASRACPVLDTGSCLSRTPSPGVASPRESRSSTQRGCRSAPSCCLAVSARGSASAWPWAVAGVVGQVPIGHPLPVASTSASPPRRRDYHLRPETPRQP
jgi:hypothetical protein